MEILFWTCWIAELVMVLWWIITDAQQTHMKANPVGYICLLFLLVVLGVRLGLQEHRTSNAMLIIPAVTLLGLGCIVVLSLLFRKKWN